MTRRISPSTTWELLGLLADGKFHSGEILARELGISRASVFNLLTKAAETGVDLSRVRGRGYRLGRPWQRLEAGSVSDLLGDYAKQFDIEILEQAASSNSLLMQRCRNSGENNGVRSGTVLAVELQTAGRGRLGRVWQSGLGNSLTFSVLWKFERGLNSLSGLSLAIGVSLIRTLNKQGVDDVYLKWPNDLVTDRGKLGGVLVEAQGEVLGPCNVVIGIGINCSVPARIRAKVDQLICGLDEVVVDLPDRNLLLAVLLKDLADVLNEFEQGGFAVLREEWERYHMHQNMRVSLNLPSGEIESGVARGINETGELCLESVRGSRWFNAGEIGTALI
jgi:BirA family biotin operon repressor/biotin-[acetyl-CoA-carboxylase] ligase